MEVLPIGGLTLDEACCVEILPPPPIAVEDTGVVIGVDDEGSAIED